MGRIIKHIAQGFPFPGNIKRMIHRMDMPVVFPFYHTVADHKPKHIEHLYPVKKVKEFEDDLDFLLQHFNPISAKELLGGSERISDKPSMVLSFDDGLVECYDIIMPILLRKGVPAVFFLNNDFVDNKGLFYRYKISLLLEKYQHISDSARAEAAELMSCKPRQLQSAIRDVSYVRREITDNIAALWDYSFDDYQRLCPVYLSSIQINRMIRKGFEFGAHGTDHPLFSILTSDQALEDINTSMDDICGRFSLDYRYFAWPFTDYGISNQTIQALFEKDIIDIGFGTAGLKNDIFENYYQRVPMEYKDSSGRQVIKGELLRRAWRKFTKGNLVDRKPLSDKEKLDLST